MTELIGQTEYKELIGYISTAYSQGQQKAVQAVNSSLLDTYWTIGQFIVEYEQGGAEKAKYGKSLINNLAIDLSKIHGKGFSRSNLIYMRLLYLEYPIGEKPSHLLSWSHYVELLKIDDKLERRFYEQQSIIERWSIPELKRQKKTSLFFRLATSKNKDQILQLAKNGQIVSKPISYEILTYSIFLQYQSLIIIQNPNLKNASLKTCNIFCWN
jgi:hypothetical protein